MNLAPRLDISFNLPSLFKIFDDISWGANNTESLPLILTLPFEILSKIFLECLPTEPYLRLAPSEAPALLCQVCSRFRSVALSEPRLWNTLVLPPIHKHPVHPSLTDKNTLKFLRSQSDTWVQRAGILPLTLGEDASAQQKRSFLVDLLPLINRYSTKIKRLTFGITKIKHFELVRKAFPTGSRAFEALEEVRVVSRLAMNPGSLEAFLTYKLEWLLEAPNLQKVSLKLEHAGLEKWVLPTRRLTHLCLDGQGDTTEWLNIFRNHPTLTHLEVTNPTTRYIKEEDTPMDEARQKLVHHNLTSLKIHVRRTRFSVGPANRLLSYPVRFPSLVHLELVFAPDTVFFDALDLHLALGGLKTLRMTSEVSGVVPVPVDQLVSALKPEVGLFPLLEELWVPYTNKQLPELVHVLDRPGLAVHVERLILGGVGDVFGSVQDRLPELDVERSRRLSVHKVVHAV